MYTTINETIINQPKNISELLEIPLVYDIILSDFGRDATSRYITLMSSTEKRLVQTILTTEGLQFYDEYRRIMYSVIADIAFFKKTQINENIKKFGKITDDILFGLGTTQNISEYAIDQLAYSVFLEIFIAITRGYETFRLLIPCNTLSNAAKSIGQRFANFKEIKRIAKCNNFPYGNL